MDTVSIFDVIILLSGVYVFYSAIIMKKTGTITSGVFITKDVSVNSNSDVPGFIQYMFIRGIFLGIVAMLCGVVGLMNDSVSGLTIIHYVLLLISFLSVCYFSWVTVKAQKKFIAHDYSKKRKK